MSVLANDAADRLLILDNVPLSNDPFTHMGYVKSIGTTGTLQTIVARLDDDLDPYMWFGLLSDGSFYYEDNSGANTDFGVDLTYDEWVHVAFAHKTNEVRLWLNGVPIGSGDAVAGLNPSTRYETLGWRVTNNGRWNGYQGVYKAWQAFLTDGQVAAEYGKAEAQLATNLYGVWPLLNDYNDYSGNDNHWNAVGLDFAGAIPGVDYGSFGDDVSIINQIMEHRRQLCY